MLALCLRLRPTHGKLPFVVAEVLLGVPFLLNFNRGETLVPFFFTHRVTRSP